MPGMHPSASLPQDLLLLGGLLLFWSVAVLHLLRLLSEPGLPDADPPADLAHTAMGIAMAYMLFPDSPGALDRPWAVMFAAAAAAFAVRALASRTTVRRVNDLRLALTSLTMTIMYTATSHPVPYTTPIIVAFLLGCAATHGRTLLTLHRLHSPALDPRHRRLLLHAPHLSTIAMTLGMAYMFAAT